MGEIIIQPETTKDPISLIGREAGVCWGADITKAKRNYKRGLDCLAQNHGRTLEFPQIYMTIDGYSAKFARELYTHIAGGPTRVQASTRYINYDNFKVVVPPQIAARPDAMDAYKKAVNQIRESMIAMKEAGVPNEDATMILPLAMTTKMVMRTNLRHLIDMAHQRMCTRAYWEYRDFMRDLCNALAAYSEEWSYLVNTYFVPKCEYLGYCPETKDGCGRKPHKEG